MLTHKLGQWKDLVYCMLGKALQSSDSRNIFITALSKAVGLKPIKDMEQRLHWPIPALGLTTVSLVVQPSFKNTNSPNQLQDRTLQKLCLSKLLWIHVPHSSLLRLDLPSSPLSFIGFMEQKEGPEYVNI